MTAGAPPPVGGHWFEPLAETLGAAYLRYSFTKGTEQEVEHLVASLGLEPGQRVLDVGCGPGRHAHALAHRGLAVHGVDISGRFIELARAAAPEGATFERLDARELERAEHLHGAFDAAICLCQGAFGLMTARSDDLTVLHGIRRCLRAGGSLALSAFNAYFAVRYHTEARFDAASGVSHERTVIRDESGAEHPADLWTGCYTPRELELLLDRAGFAVASIASVEPGAYGTAAASIESPEFLVLAQAIAS